MPPTNNLLLTALPKRFITLASDLTQTPTNLRSGLLIRAQLKAANHTEASRKQTKRRYDRVVKRNPQAKKYPVNAVLRAEETGKPFTIEGIGSYTPTTYTPVLASFNPSYKTEEEMKAGQARANAELLRRLTIREQELLSDIMSHTTDYLPLSSFGHMGLYDWKKRVGNPSATNAEALSIALGGAVDLGTSAFGVGGWRPLLGSWIGGETGRYIGNKYDHPILGLIAGSLAGGFSPSLYNNISSRFTPNGFRTGNNTYSLLYTSQGTMSTGGFGELSGIKLNKTPVTSWSLLSLPGFHIKSTLTGSPLERQLSKNGTLSLKQLQAYVGRNDIPAIDKELIGRVLLNHAGDTHIDYNTLRLEILGMIPLYNRVFLILYLNYGASNLGFSRVQTKRLGRQLLFDEGDFMKEEEIPFLDVSFNAFTFESPGIIGNTKHYKGSPIGHSRTYTTADDPDVLHVMESLSDWALSGGVTGPGKRYTEMALNNAKADLESGNYGFYTKEELELRVSDLTKTLQRFEIDPILKRMVDTYLNRQIQENLRYAAENGLTRMRYPTPETAAKIEGYTKVIPQRTSEQLATILDNPEYIRACIDINNKRILGELESMYRARPDKNTLETLNYLKELLYKNPGKSVFEVGTFPKESYYSPFFRALDATSDKRLEEIMIILNKLLNFDPTPKYLPEHQTILRKYADFPKQYLKLFGKLAKVRIVTDAKGNTWYEVDVPLNYLDGTAEMLFKKGGNLNVVLRFKKYRRNAI